MTTIAQELLTQDNAITADPIFMVQEQVRVYGIDTDFDPTIAWLYEDDSVEVSEEEAGALEVLYRKSGSEPNGYRRVGYHQDWHNRQPFFTRAAAERYIRSNGHNHSGPLRIYVESAYRNPEWRSVRARLAEFA